MQMTGLQAAQFQCIRFECGIDHPPWMRKPESGDTFRRPAEYAACCWKCWGETITPLPHNGCSVFIGFLP